MILKTYYGKAKTFNKYLPIKHKLTGVVAFSPV